MSNYPLPSKSCSKSWFLCSPWPRHPYSINHRSIQLPHNFWVIDLHHPPQKQGGGFCSPPRASRCTQPQTARGDDSFSKSHFDTWEEIYKKVQPCPCSGQQRTHQMKTAACGTEQVWRPCAWATLRPYTLRNLGSVHATKQDFLVWWNIGQCVPLALFPKRHKTLIQPFH